MSSTQIETFSQPFGEQGQSSSADQNQLHFHHNHSPPHPPSDKSGRRDSDTVVDIHALLKLCDSVRSTLRGAKPAGRTKEDHVAYVLENLLTEETESPEEITLGMIKLARLDKLVNDVLDLSVGTRREAPRPTAEIDMARELDRLWRERFGSSYAALDIMRAADMRQTGRLRNVYFDEENAESWYLRWGAERDLAISQRVQPVHFTPGNWWLNLACAYRDGIVGHSLEKPSTDRFGVTTLPLLTGCEEYISGDTVKYIREGKSHAMHIGLISKVGFQIRILRGYRLKSIFAPAAGVRYDGLYTIRQYGKKLDTTTETYRLELLLERVPDQRPLEELRCVPRPSQLDEWAQYEDMEGKLIRQKAGEAAFAVWQAEKDKERIEGEEWEQIQALHDDNHTGEILVPTTS